MSHYGHAHHHIWIETAVSTGPEMSLFTLSIRPKSEVLKGDVSFSTSLSLLRRSLDEVLCPQVSGVSNNNKDMVDIYTSTEPTHMSFTDELAIAAFMSGAGSTTELTRFSTEPQKISNIFFSSVYSYKEVLETYFYRTDVSIDSVSWSTILAVGKALVAKAYVVCRCPRLHFETFDDVLRYKAASRSQEEFDARARVWEIKKQVWYTTLDLGAPSLSEKKSARKTYEYVVDTQIHEEFHNIFQPWDENWLSKKKYADGSKQYVAHTKYLHFHWQSLEIAFEHEEGRLPWFIFESFPLALFLTMNTCIAFSVIPYQRLVLAVVDSPGLLLTRLYVQLPNRATCSDGYH